MTQAGSIDPVTIARMFGSRISKGGCSQQLYILGLSRLGKCLSFSFNGIYRCINRVSLCHSICVCFSNAGLQVAVNQTLQIGSQCFLVKDKVVFSGRYSTVQQNIYTTPVLLMAEDLHQ